VPTAQTDVGRGGRGQHDVADLCRLSQQRSERSMRRPSSPRTNRPVTTADSFAASVRSSAPSPITTPFVEPRSVIDHTSPSRSRRACTFESVFVSSGTASAGLPSTLRPGARPSTTEAESSGR